MFDRDLHGIDAKLVQSTTKGKQFRCRSGEGIRTDMRAVRKNYALGAYDDCFLIPAIRPITLRNPISLGVTKLLPLGCSACLG